jgi:translation initiation factor RLI1
MPKPTASVDYQLCKPTECGCRTTACLAVRACEHKVLRQDETGDPPYAWSTCVGCGTCVTACPLKAIRLV